MNEERLGYQIRQRLNAGLEDLPDQTKQRLAQARARALAAQKVNATELVMGVAGHRQLSDSHHGHDSSRLRWLLAASAVVLGMTLGYYYWEGQTQLDELEEIDSALLGDELPPDAYLDKGFAAWLKHSSEE